MSHPERVPPSTAGLPGRTSHEIRRDIESQRQELGRSWRRCAIASTS